MSRLLLARVLLSSIAVLMIGCVGAWKKESNLAPTMHYVGSSTIANFIRDAEPVYKRVRFIVDTEAESVGGELAIREGRADIAGVAGKPKPETLEMGVVATLIGKDAIAVVVNQANPVNNLTHDQLKGIFTGKYRNWSQLGGPDLEIHPFIVGPESATRKVFRSAILGEADYAGCEIVRPDTDLPMKVEAEPGGIGQISFSFLGSCGAVKALTVDGQRPVSTNLHYPITRPLYLLWWPGRDRVTDFITWTTINPEAEAILLNRFTKTHEAKSQSHPGGSE